MFRVATWNMHSGFNTASQRSAGWTYLADSVKPDVALIQEAMVPEGFPHPSVHRPEGIGGGRNWGSAIVSYGPLLNGVTHAKNAPLMQTFPGTVMVADVNLEGGSTITAVSLYGAIEHGFAVTTVHKQISDLQPLFDSNRGDQVLLGGDFNCSTQLEPPYRYQDANLFERLRVLGLVDLLELTRDSRTSLPNCVCDDVPNCGHVQTQRHRSSPIPWQNDYLFASEKLARKLTDCYAIDDGDPDPWSLSDHCPVVAAFDM